MPHPPLSSEQSPRRRSNLVGRKSRVLPRTSLYSLFLVAIPAVTSRCLAFTDFGITLTFSLVCNGSHSFFPLEVHHLRLQPMSAMQANLSSGCTSKTYLTVRAAPRRYPPVVCTTPLGLPVEPEVCRD